jgi:hypothetical protein
MTDLTPSPQRHQRQRTKGWRKPEGAVYVGRGTEWGNPHDWQQHGRAKAVELFEQHQIGSATFRRAARAALAGKDLMCWCPPGAPCHADALLRIANDGLKTCGDCGEELPLTSFPNDHWRCKSCRDYVDAFGSENMFDSYMGKSGPTEYQ